MRACVLQDGAISRKISTRFLERTVSQRVVAIVCHAYLRDIIITSRDFDLIVVFAAIDSDRIFRFRDHCQFRFNFSQQLKTLLIIGIFR